VTKLEQLPPGLPAPEDDGACRHLPGMHMPSVCLPATSGDIVDLSALAAPRTVLYAYPMTGQPGTTLPTDWDAIPGARGCTPQACTFRDHCRELAELGAGVFGLSTQDTAYQREMAARLHLPFPVLSDSALALTTALRLPTFVVDGMRLIRRLTLIVRAGVIEKVFYPVFPPDQSAAQVIDWLKQHSLDEDARRGSNQGNTQNEKSLYHQSSIDFRCYLEMALFEPRPGRAEVSVCPSGNQGVRLAVRGSEISGHGCLWWKAASPLSGVGSRYQTFSRRWDCRCVCQVC